MFELAVMTKAKLTEVIVLSQKNRQPEENPGAKLTLELTLPNHSLSMFDGGLKSSLFTKAGGAQNKAAQATLDGVEVVSDMPNLSGVGSRIGAFTWHHDLTGYSLVIDLGLGGKKSNLEIEDCSLSGWKITPKEGGSVLIKVNVESADVSESAFGRLAKMKSRDIQVLLAAPEVTQQELEETPPKRTSGPPIDGTVTAFKRDVAKRSRGKDATEAFLEASGVPPGASS
jgi:hypothetical protein